MNERKMAAPVGNQFWKLRSKHGRDKLFATPELLWEAACEYFEWCDENPLKSYEWNGKDPVKCELEKMRPYTLTGLCLYLDCSEAYFRAFKTDKEKCTDEFLTVITRIESTVYSHKFEGAAAGFFNANIIARDLGLTDKKDVTTAGEKVGIPIIVANDKTKDIIEGLGDK